MIPSIKHISPYGDRPLLVPQGTVVIVAVSQMETQDIGKVDTQNMLRAVVFVMDFSLKN